MLGEVLGHNKRSNEARLARIMPSTVVAEVRTA